MARRKKARHHHTRRHKMSGIGGSAMNALYIGAGAIAGEALANALTSMTGAQGSSSMSNLIPPGATIVAGIFLPKILKGDIGEGLGAGMVATGCLYAAQNFGIISGIGETPKIAGKYSNKPIRRIAGYQTASGAMVSGMPVQTAAALESAN